MAGMTEEEAVQKWCSQSMGNCGENGEGLFPCCGSSCMAWRWSNDLTETAITAAGYCGIAGKP